MELKNKVLRKINQINDEQVLTEVYKLLENSFDDTEVFKLTENHKIAIEEAKSQISRGEYLINEQVNKEIDEWLNK